MSNHIENLTSEKELTLNNSSNPLTIHTTSLSLPKQNDQIIECRLTFHVTPELYHHIYNEKLFNLKPELCSNFSNGEFISEPNIEITTRLKPDLLTHLTPHDDALTYLKNLNQEQPEHPIFSTENWFALQVKQQRLPIATGYRTFWDYLSPSVMNADTVDSEEINNAIFQFFQDWADTSLSGITESAISQAFEEITKGFEEWVDTSLSAINEDAISEIIEEITKAFAESDGVNNPQMYQTSSQQSIFQGILNFFTEDDWSYTKIKTQPTLHLAFQGKNGKWDCYAKAREQQQQFVFYSISPVNVPENKRLPITEFITRANYGMIMGNFEFDFTTGEIRYKTSIDVEGDNLSFALIKQMVYANVMMMDEYLPGIMAVIEQEVEVKEAISRVEG